MNRVENLPISDLPAGTNPARLNKGLSGKNIVITRAPHQSAALAHLLREKGARPILYPCIDIVLPEKTNELDKSLVAVENGEFDWLVITSANTASILAIRMAALNVSLSGIQVAAIGPKTADSVEELLGLKVDFIAKSHTGKDLASTMPAITGKRILLPQAEIAHPDLANGLAEAGASIKVVSAYRTILGQGGDNLPSMLRAGQVDAVTFTSSSTVRNFLVRLEQEHGDRADLNGVCLAAIGPTTADTLTKVGLKADVVPDRYRLTDLVTTMEKYYLNLINNGAAANAD